jgi:hypothetical protein
MAAHESISPHIHESVAKFFGKGSEEMFGGAVKTPAPWPSAGRSKALQDYDPEVVSGVIARAPEDIAEVDPRTLHASQPWITSAGVEHYMSGQYEETGKTFADSDNAGNVYPVVYMREVGERVTPIILSGHHRAAAALAQGRPLRALVARGGWGPPRQRQQGQP